MKLPKAKSIILLLLSWVCIVNTSISQENINASANEIVNETGSVSYSVGQVFTQCYSNELGTINEGIQLSYEILVITGLEETDINIEASVFPNPAENYLILDIGNKNYSEMSYQVFNLDGKLMMTVKITSKQTNISLSGLSTSNYFIKVMDGNQAVKTFKVIKR